MTNADYFATKLAMETDVADVQAAMAGGDPGFVLVDSRSDAAWDQGHIPGAIHLPTVDIPKLAAERLDPAMPVVTYCWGPGCNGATRAALALARQGYQAKEMIGGFEYWVREGFATASRPSPLAAVVVPTGHTRPGEHSSCGCR